jgi:hypothetical protein
MRLFFRTTSGETHGVTAIDAGMLASLTEHASGTGFNSYVQVNPTQKKGMGRVSGEHITHWSWFVVDIDPTGPNPKLEEAVQFVESFVANYFGMLNLKSTVIYSGRGMQCWFPLEPLDCDMKMWVHHDQLSRAFELGDVVDVAHITTIREAAPRAMGYWLDTLRSRLAQVIPDAGCTIDTCSSDLPRVMRLPWTWNFKTRRPTVLLKTATGPNVGLAHKLITYAPYRIWKEQEAPVGLGDVDAETPWQRFVPHLTVGARIFLTEGASEGGRHRQAAAALLSLKELGCGPAQAQAALLWGASLCSPALEPREIMPMIERHWRK